MIMRETPIVLIISIAFITGCTRNEKLFESLSSGRTGINFINHNEDTDSLSILDYLYFYNGAGVAVGDINNDSLPDIYFTANQGGNKLFLNKGDFHFEDITLSAGVRGNADWTTGVTMADVNGDGFLDIYVSVVSPHQPKFGPNTTEVYFAEGTNQLFINNGNSTFTEKAASYGLALKGYNTQAAFFDYDRDGDLDLFQLQHSIHQTDTYGDTSLRRKYSEISGGKLYRNDSNNFTNVTVASGIFSSALGYGLGVAVADFNNDGWDDLYVGNDFHESDYYYINNGDGTFREKGLYAFGHTSNFSMGNDAGDINNDGWMDIITLDMLPADEKILKSSAGDDAFDVYTSQRSLGYSYQYARNSLQLNTGKGNFFSDVALYANVAATDWSWSALLADYDLDGNTDLFVTNGIKRRLNDLDYVKFISSDAIRENAQGNRIYDKEMLKRQPPGEWNNYMFKGSDSLRFSDHSADWGFAKKNLSHGAAYADLDNDGDLDLVTNNMNEQAGVFRNYSREKDTSLHFINLSIGGYAKNSRAIGAKVAAKANGRWHYFEVQATRGFLSSVDTRINIGLGNANKVDSLFIQWPDSSARILFNLPVNRHYTIEHLITTNGGRSPFPSEKDSNIFFSLQGSYGINFIHNENLSFSDFNRQWFIPHHLSTAGPRAAVADVNKDGLEDIFIGGAKFQPAALYLQQRDARFLHSTQPDIQKDSACEDVHALFFDADNDSDQDLYVVSGGNEYFGTMPQLNDRLYTNDGKGNFTKSAGLPAMFENKSVVATADFDKDGDIDLFVGGRADSKVYGKLPVSYLLVNNGKGQFSIATDMLAAGLSNIGLVTAAAWADLDGDNDQDLIVTGEWMRPEIFINANGRLQRSTKNNLVSGWYQSLAVWDADLDGDTDVLLGNYGLNGKLTPGKDPLKMYLTDLDDNNNADQLLAVGKNGVYYPFLGKENLEKQLPYLKKEHLQYSGMAGKTVTEIFSGRIKDAVILEAEDFTSVLMLNDGKGSFQRLPLPSPLQWSPIFSFLPGEFNGDGKPDFIAVGNFYGVIPFEGRYDAMLPMVCTGDGKGNFDCRPISSNFAAIGGEGRDLKIVELANGSKAILYLRNNTDPVFLGFKR